MHLHYSQAIVESYDKNIITYHFLILDVVSASDNNIPQKQFE